MKEELVELFKSTCPHSSGGDKYEQWARIVYAAAERMGLSGDEFLTECLP